MAVLRAKQYPFYTVYKWELSYLDFKSLSGANASFLLFNFPQRYNIAFVKTKCTTRFQGTGITSMRVITRPAIGASILTGTTGIITDHTVSNVVKDFAGTWKYTDQLSGPIDGVTQGYASSQEAANGLFLQGISVGGNLSALNAGELTLWVGTIPTF